jgi:hypothetical protein
MFGGLHRLRGSSARLWCAMDARRNSHPRCVPQPPFAVGCIGLRSRSRVGLTSSGPVKQPERSSPDEYGTGSVAQSRAVDRHCCNGLHSDSGRPQEGGSAHAGSVADSVRIAPFRRRTTGRIDGRAWLARVWFNDPASQLSGWEPQTHSLGMDSRKASKQGFPFPVPRTHFNCGAREEEQTNRRGSHTERNLQIEPGGARLMAGRSRPNARTLHLSSAVDGAPPRRAPRIER